MCDVITGDEVTGGKCEDPITEMPASLFEPPIGIRANDTVDPETTLLLERAHRRGNHLVVVTGNPLVEEAKMAESASHLVDGGAGCAQPQQHSARGRGRVQQAVPPSALRRRSS